MKVQTFCQMVFGRELAIWNRDIDKSAPEALLHLMCELTGATKAQAYQSTLRSFEGFVYEHHNPCANTKWILPLGIYHRTRKGFGLMYCPLCLKEDKEPYFRKQWRLAFHLICDRHGTLMCDRCPSCGTAVVFFRRELGRRSEIDGGEITLCHACGFDLRFAPAHDPPAPDGQVLAMLRSLIMFRDLGWWFAGVRHIAYSHLYLDVVHHLAALIGARRGRKLREEIERQTRRKLPDLSIGNIKLEMRPFWERYWMVLLALWALQDWPQRFRTVNAAAGLSSAWLLLGECLPSWFELQVREDFGRASYVPNVHELACVAAFLKRENTKISMAAIGRVLGGRGYVAAKPFVVATTSLWPCTQEKFVHLLAELDRRSSLFKVGSVSWLLSQRDRLVLQLMSATTWKAGRVLRISLQDVAGPLRENIDLLLFHEVTSYIRHIRQPLLGRNDGKMLFVGAKRDGIGIDAFRQRICNLSNSAPVGSL